jgi:integrase
MSRLTIHFIRKAPPGLHNDGRGLYLRVKPSGARSWLYRYKARWMGLGSLDDVDLEEARDLAHQARKAVRAGADPILERRKQKLLTSAATVTFEECAKSCHEAQSSKWRTEKHREGWLDSFQRYIFPKLGGLPIAAVDTNAVVDALKPIWSKQYDTGRRLRQRVEAVIDHASALGLRSGDNPARWSGHLEHLLANRDKTEQKHFAAMPWREVPDFVARLREHATVPAMALEFLILTAARAGEVLNAKRPEVQGDLLVIPPERTKVGKEFRVTLSKRAQEILANVPSEGEYLFPGRFEGKPLGHNALREMLKQQLKIEDITIHGFRSSFRDWAADATRFANHVVEMCLAHSVGGVEGAYRRGEMLDQRRKVMEAWAGYLAAPVRTEVIPWTRERSFNLRASRV